MNCIWECIATSASQVKNDLVPRLGATYQQVSVGRLFEWLWLVADSAGNQPAFAAMTDPCPARPPLLPADAPAPGHWASPPANWNDLPEQRLLSQETIARILSATEALLPSQRAVTTLRVDRRRNL